jgi:hypothetical protein
MDKLSRYKENREALKELSKLARILVKEEAFDTINEAIIETVYRKDGHEEFNTLPEWNKRGFRVIKGSRAFVVWGRPKKVQEAEQNQTEEEPEEGEDNGKIWPLCYLFSNLQVETTQEKRRAA